MTSSDVLVVGAGPAGMAAATTASSCGASVCVIDENAQCGGQIWRGRDHDSAENPPVRRFIQLTLESGQIDVRYGTRVVANPAPSVLRLETAIGFEDIRYRSLILATGARERFLPFPGWTV
jgi:NADPH-dependent 2,4-dienoyl-CoA reductase/sulfur reductase-like enzyme